MPAGSLLPGLSDDRQRLRQAVLAGPGASVAVGEGGGVLGLLAGTDVIAAALTRCGHVDQRRRVLTGVVTVMVALGLCLFRREGYDAVLARMMAVLPGRVAPGDPPPTGAALSQARARVGDEPVPGSVRGHRRRWPVPGPAW